MGNQKKRILAVGLVAFFLLAGVTVAERFVPSEDPVREDEQPAISLLAPYETGIHRDYLLRMASEFEQEHGIRVEIIFRSGEDYIDHLMTRAVQENLPDMVIIDSNYLSYLAGEGLLVELTDVVQSILLDEREDGRYYPVLWESGYIDYSYYAVPFTCSTYALYCNTSILQERGCTAPVTLEELENTAYRVMGSGPAPFAFSGKQTDQATYHFFSMFFANGCSFLDINSTEGTGLMQVFERMSTSRILTPHCVNWRERDLTNQFLKGEVAMMINSSNQYQSVAEGATSFDWEVVPVPAFAGSGDSRQPFYSSESMAILSEQNEQFCRTFITYAYRRENLVQTALTLGSIPVRSDILPDVFNRQDALAPVFYSQAEGMQGIRAYRLWGGMSASVQNHLFDVLTLTARAEDASEQIQSEIRNFRVSGL